MSRGHMKFAAVLVSTSLAACSTAQSRECFPGGGREVWTERHWTSGPESTGPATLVLKLVPDSAGVPEMGWQTSIVVTDTLNANPIQAGVPINGIVRFRLPPGLHLVHVRELRFVSVRRRIMLAAGSRVEVELQRQHAPYCLLPPVRTSM